MAALALIFSYVEVLFPLPVGIPGVKLGIANLVVIIALYRFDWRYASAVNLVRVLVAGLLFTGPFGMMYSLSGAILSMVLMVCLKKSGCFSIIGVSMGGGVFHNLGQLLMAIAIMEDSRLFVYFPVLLFSGLVTGVIIGIVSYEIMKRLKIADL